METKAVARRNFCINNLYFWIYGILSLLYITLAMHFPVSIYTTSVHDDAWFIANAEKILAGQWLGAFNQMTFIKGQGYSYFLALNALIGIPITFSLAIIYLVACFLFITTLRKVGLGKLVALVLFAVLIFQPALFPTRIIRDNIYFSFLLISLSGLIYAAICSTEQYRKPILVISGLCFGMFWITREEGLWVLPGFATIILYFLYQNHKEKWRLRLIIKSLLIYTLAALVIPLSTASINYFVYGRFQNVDFKSASFTKALNALNSVYIGKEVQYVPVPQKKREAIYKVSPSFKELEAYFEGAGRGWTNYGCALFEHTCEDYAGGWFMWALRDGVASLGYYNNPMVADKFYEQIAREIQSACNQGELKCKRTVIPYMPRITSAAIHSIPEKMIEAINVTIYKIPISLTGGPSSKPIDRMGAISDFLGNPRIVSPYHSKLQVSGWYYASPEKWLSLSCLDNNGQKNIPIDRGASSDIATHFNNAKAQYQRFSLVLEDFEKCSLVVLNSQIKAIPLNNLLNTQQKSFKIADGHIHFDTFQVIDLNRGHWLGLKQSLTNIYSTASLYVFAAGSLLTILSGLILVYLKRSATDLMVITVCLWILYYSRIAIVVMVDITSFPAINSLYLLPAFPLWTTASIVGIATFMRLIISIQHISYVRDRIAEK